MRDIYSTIPSPPAHRIYNVGEQVVYGNHEKTVVVNVSEDKRIYSVNVTNDRKKHYEKKPKFVTELREGLTWMQLIPLKNESNGNIIPFGDHTFHPLNYSQRDINSLILLCHNEYGGVDFDPDYQRGSVWDLEDKILLLDSIFAQRDIGKFVINERAWSDTGPLREIVDGKQRLSAIKEFYEDGFKYKGLYYSELNRYDRTVFKNHCIAVATLNEATHEQILKTFLAVNITGKVQNLDHIENVKKILENEND